MAKLKTRNVFLDTQVLIANGYRYKGWFVGQTELGPRFRGLLLPFRF
jgi:hypothetical protein